MTVVVQLFASMRRAVSSHPPYRTQAYRFTMAASIRMPAQRPPLLELFALFQHRRQQFDETLQRGAPVGIKPDVMERGPSPGCGGAVKDSARSRSPPNGEPTSLTTLGVVCSSGARISRTRFRYPPRHSRAAPPRRGCPARDGRQIALQVDDGIDFARGIEGAERLENPVRPGRMVGARHHRLAAMGGHRLGDLGCVGGDSHPADLRGLRPAQHMDDHRRPGDVRSGLRGRRVAASRAGISTKVRVCVIGSFLSLPLVGRVASRRLVGWG